MDRLEIERKIMDTAVVEKTWEIPAHGGRPGCSGPDHTLAKSGGTLLTRPGGAICPSSCSWKARWTTSVI
ncbi:MAG: hypothetical protein ACRDRW_16370 [Pseudonocardiaceae bacterium]